MNTSELNSSVSLILKVKWQKLVQMILLKIYIINIIVVAIYLVYSS